MKITGLKSHVLAYELPEELGYSQQYYALRTVHLVEVTTDEGITGWGECFGPGNVALANKAIVEKVIRPMVLGKDPLDRDVIWHEVYNLLRDHGQKGMPIQALSGVDIALWDIAGKVASLPVHKLIGGAHRSEVDVYGYGMMLKRESISDHLARFTDEASAIKDMGFAATKMKVGLGPKEDVQLAVAVRRGIGDDFPFMVDANHCYTTPDALYVGRALEELKPYCSKNRWRRRILKVTVSFAPSSRSTSRGERRSLPDGVGEGSLKTAVSTSHNRRSAGWEGLPNICAC